MLSVKQLLYYTHLHRPSILKKAREITVRIDSDAMSTDEDGDQQREVEATCVGDTIARYVSMVVYGKIPEAKVWCSCTCEYFLYHTEVALKSKGSTNVIHSNGKRPKETNPNMVAHLCKHCVAVLIALGNSKPKKSKPVKPTKPIKK
jgi:hypothetical protein